MTAVVFWLSGCQGIQQLADAITLNPAQVTLKPGQTQQFTPAVNGQPEGNNVTGWFVDDVQNGNADVGTIANGLYTAPQSSGVHTIKAQVQVKNKNGNVDTLSATSTATISNGTKTPAATISVSPDTISSGQCAEVSWSTSDVNSCQVNGTNADIPSGSMQVCPTSTTVYSITCTGPDGGASNSTTLTVQGTVNGISVMIDPTSATVGAGGSLAFTATVTGDGQNRGVTWTATLGVIQQGTLNPLTATFTAPGVSQSTTVTVTATSVSDTSKFATATVTVTPGNVCNSYPPPQITIDPGFPIIHVSQSQVLTASDQNNLLTQPAAFTWLIDTTANPGTITPDPTNSSNATYQAPAVATTVHVRATSVQCPSRWGEATVQVQP